MDSGAAGERAVVEVEDRPCRRCAAAFGNLEVVGVVGLLGRFVHPLAPDEIVAARSTSGAAAKNGEKSSERCQHCLAVGYLGRTGIFELLMISDAIRNLIREKPNLNEIKQMAIKSGMLYLYEDGMLQVIEGRTSIQELLRVAK